MMEYGEPMENEENRHQKNIVGTREKVKEVTDGDTVKLESGERVRLHGVDAPEFHPREQNYGREAKNFLEKLLAQHDNEIVLMRRGTDKYRRTIGTVYVGDGEDVSLQLVKNGLGWAYRQYLKGRDLSEFVKAESFAKRQRIGIWTENHPVNPATFRKKNRREKRGQANLGVGNRQSACTGANNDEIAHYQTDWQVSNFKKNSHKNSEGGSYQTDMSLRLEDRISNAELEWAIQSSLKVQKMREEKTTFQFLTKLAEKVESLEREAQSRASSKPHTWFYWWIKLLKRLSSTQKSCSRLLAIHKYLSAVGYLANRIDRRSADAALSDGACMDSETALAVSENVRLKARYGMDLSAIATARGYYRRTATYKCLKFLEAATRLLKKLVPEFASSFEGAIENNQSNPEESVQKKFKLSVKTLYEDAVASFVEELSENPATEDGDSVITSLRTSNLVDRFLEVLPVLPDPGEPSNRFVGGRIFGKLEKIPYNPGGSSQLNWGVMSQKKKIVAEKCSTPLSSFLASDFALDGRFRYAYSDSGMHKLGKDPNCASEIEKEKREALAFRIEHPLRDRRTVNNLVSFCIKFAVEVDAILGHPSVRSDVGASAGERVGGPCGSVCVETWEAAFGRCAELAESIFLLMNDAYGLPYVAALHAETEMRSSAKALWSTFQEYVVSREVGAVKHESLDADDPDGTVALEEVAAEEASPLPVAEPAEETPLPPIGAKMLKAQFDTARLVRALGGQFAATDMKEGDETEALASNDPPSAPSLQDRVALALARYVSACKIMTKKFLSSCFRPGNFGLRFKPGYDPGSDGETADERFRKNAIKNFSKPLKRFQEEIELHCDKVNRYFGTPEGNQQKPTFKECVVGVWSINSITKSFRVQVRWAFILCYVAWCGTPRSYCFYGHKRYLEKCESSTCYYYGKVSSELKPRGNCRRSRTRADASEKKPGEPPCCATGSQGTGEPLAASFSDELPRLDHCLYSVSKAMEKLIVRCKEGSFHDLLGESVLASKPFSRFSDYVSSGILTDEDDVPETPGTGNELSKSEATAAREVVAAAKIWLSAKRETDFLSKKHLGLCFDIYVCVVRFYLVYLGEMGFGTGVLLQKTRGKKFKVDVYEFLGSKGYERKVPFVPPLKVSAEGVGYLRKNTSEVFRSVRISRNNACALFEAESEDELTGIRILQDLLSYEDEVTKALWVSAEAVRVWTRFLVSFGYDSVATDSRYAPWVNETVDAEKGKYEGRSVAALLYGSFGRLASEKGLTWTEGPRTVASQLTASNAIQLEFLGGVLESAQKALGDCAVSVASKFVYSGGSDVRMSVPTAETPTESAVRELGEEEKKGMASETTELEVVAEPAELALVGADFWTNHHGVNRGFNSAWRRGKKEGYAEGFLAGEKSGLATGRDELEDTKHLASEEFLRRADLYESDYGDVLLHLYVSLKDVPTVAESESYDSDALRVSRDLMSYHQHLGDSKAFLAAFNDDGTELHNRPFYRDKAWQKYRKERYAKYWSEFDRCFKVWGQLYTLNEIVQMHVSETVFQERLINGDPGLMRLSGARFFDPEKYPHPANMLYTGMLYRKLLDKTPLIYGDRTFALSIMAKSFRLAIKNTYKNFSKQTDGKYFQRYVSRSIKLHDWVSTNLEPVLYRILVELQELAAENFEGNGHSGALPAFKSVPEKVTDPRESPYETKETRAFQQKPSSPASSSSEEEKEKEEEEEGDKKGIENGSEGAKIPEETNRAENKETDDPENREAEKGEEKVEEEEEEDREEGRKENSKEPAKNISITIGGAFATTRTHTYRGEGEKLTTITATTTDPKVAEQLKRGALESDVQRQAVLRTAAGHDVDGDSSVPVVRARQTDEERMYEAYEMLDSKEMTASEVPDERKTKFEDVDTDSTATGGNIYEKFIDDLTFLKKKKKLLPVTGYMFGPPLNIFEGKSHPSGFEPSRTAISRNFVDEFMTSLAVVEFECSAVSRKLKGKGDKKPKKKAMAEKRLLKKNAKLRRYYEVPDSEMAPIGSKAPGVALSKETNELGDPEPRFASPVSTEVDLGLHHAAEECDGTNFVTDAFISWLKELEEGELLQGQVTANTATDNASKEQLLPGTETVKDNSSDDLTGVPPLEPVGPRLWKKLSLRSKNKAIMELAMSLSEGLMAGVKDVLEKKVTASSSKRTPCATNSGGNDCSLQKADSTQLSLGIYQGLSKALGKEKDENSWLAEFVRQHTMVVVLDPTAEGKIEFGPNNVFALRNPTIPLLLGEEASEEILPTGLSAEVILNAKSVPRTGNMKDYKGDVRSKVLNPKRRKLTFAPTSMKLLAAEDDFNAAGRRLVFVETLGSSKVPQHAVSEIPESTSTPVDKLTFYPLDNFAPVNLYESFAIEGASADRRAPVINLTVGVLIAPSTANLAGKPIALLDLSRRGASIFPNLVTFTHPGRPVKRGKIQLTRTSKEKTTVHLGEMEYVIILMAPRASLYKSPFDGPNKK